MFTRSITNTLTFLLKTPLVPQATGPQAVELATITRPRAASRTLSAYSVRGYASGKGKKELYSDEAGSIGAGIDDVAHTDAAFDGSTANPNKAAKDVEKESGKDFTNQSSPNSKYSKPQEANKDEKPLRTSKSEAGKQ